MVFYFKSNKISNVVTNAIEKFEGYNSLSENEISVKIYKLGYKSRAITCAPSKDDCPLVLMDHSQGDRGYCVYYCEEDDYYYYKIRTNMMISIPIINNILDLPVYATTNRLYNFH